METSILMIEDNEGDIRLVREMLSESRIISFNLESAGKLEEGISKLSQKRYDAVLLDMNLPDSTGTRTFIQIKKLFPEVPVVILTGQTDEEMGDYAVTHGAQDYILKNQVYKDLLIRSLHYAVERQSLEEKVRISETHYRMLFETSRHGILLLDQDSGEITDLNPRFIYISGYPREEIIGKTLWEIGPFINDPQNEAFFREVLAKEFTLNEELSLLNKNGSMVNIEFSSSCYSVNEKKVIQCNLRDISERKKAEDIIRASEKSFRSSFNNFPLGIRIVTIEGETLYVNQSLLDIFGYTSFAEFAAVPSKVRYTPESYLAHCKREEQRKKGKNVQSKYEIQIIRRDGKVRDLEVSRGDVIWNGQKQFQVIYRDITEKKILEAVVQKSEEKYRTLYETMKQGIVYHDASGKIISGNPAAAMMLGVTRQQIENDEVKNILPVGIREDGSPFEVSPIMQSIATGKPLHNLIMGIPPHQQIDHRWFLCNVTPLFHPGAKKPYQVFVTFDDITNLKKIESDLIKNQEHLTLAQEGAMIGSFEYDYKTGSVLYSHQIEKLYGTPPRGSTGTHEEWLESIHPADRKAAYTVQKNAVKAGEYNHDFRVVWPDGSIHWIYAKGKVYKNDNGEAVRMVGINMDITERKSTEELNTLSLRLLEGLNKPLSLRNIVIDFLGVLKDFSDLDAAGIRLQEGEDYPYFETNGFTEDHLQLENSLVIKNSNGDIYRDGNGKPILECLCGHVIRGDTTNNKYSLFTKNGSFWTNNIAGLLKSASEDELKIITRGCCVREGYQSIALIPIRTSGGITGLLQLNRYKPNAFNSDMIQHLEGMVGTIGMIIEKKQAEEALVESETKYRSLVNNIKMGIYRATPDEKGRFLEINPAFEQITGYSRKELMNMNICDLYLEPETRKKRCTESIASRFPLTHEHLWKKKDGTVINVSATISVVRNEQGDVLYFDGLLEDTTERKQAQIHALEMESLKKLNQAKSELLTNVSHELRTPLASIKGNIESLLEWDVRWNPRQRREFLEEANHQADHLNDLIKELLDMSRLESGKFTLNKTRCSLQEILDSCADKLKPISLNHKLMTLISPELPGLYADKIHIGEVITNLVENAAKFSAEGSCITIKAEVSKNEMILSIKDEGEGISREDMPRLFDRFFQAERVVSGKTRGTGLGLTICKGIVEAHNGKIWVESQFGKGSEFSFSLPLMKSKARIK
jgi:PAS domain S-box-containing protein